MANSACQAQYEEKYGSKYSGNSEMGTSTSSSDTVEELFPSSDWYEDEAEEYFAAGAEGYSSDQGILHDDRTEEPSRRPQPSISKVHIETYPGAGFIHRKGDNAFSKMWKEDRFYEQRKANSYYPFSCYMDFEVGKWLTELGAPMSKVDQFFRLKYVQARPLSFSSSDNLREKVEQLPSPPRWKEVPVAVSGGSTKKPLVIRYRDGLECFEFLFGNPLFLGHTQTVPKHIWEDESKKDRIYSEMMTGDMVWDVQSKVSPGETLGLVILGSDKTHLTNNQGDKECHAVYMSCGNIDKGIRTKARSRCWIKCAQIPIAKFEQTSFQGLLTRRLYHKSMDVVFSNLKKCSHEPKLMADPAGDIRLVRTILSAHLADLPEQQTIAGVSSNSSPSSIATHHQLGDGILHSIRRGSKTLKAIAQINKTCSPTNLTKYLFKAKLMGLNGVDRPFWRDWKFADPSTFLAPDALHQWHKFFADHAVVWAQKLLGDEEYDRRLCSLQRRVGFRHFTEGVTKFKQHTQKETKDLERSIVALIKGHPSVSQEIICAFRALLDFFYTVQYDSQSSGTLEDIEGYLDAFHRYKGGISRSGVRDGPGRQGKFNIQKLELANHVTRCIRNLGSAMQFTTEQTERAHITDCKQPYKLTNHKGFEAQMCRKLDNLLRVHVFEQLIQWDTFQKKESEWVGPLSTREYEETSRKKASAHLAAAFLPPPVKDISSSKRAIRNESSVWLLNSKYHDSKVPFDTAEIRYGITGLVSSLKEYLKAKAPGSYKGDFMLPFNSLNIWWSIRVQLKDPQDGRTPLPLMTVVAQPPLAGERRNTPGLIKQGCYNFVLSKDTLRRTSIEGIVGEHFVGQLRLIFQPIYYGGWSSKGTDEPLVYLQTFNPGHGATGRPVGSAAGSRAYLTEDGIEMFRVQRSLREDKSRRGIVVPLRDLWMPVELIPRFGRKCPEEWTCDSAVELAKEFYVNSFSDKTTYQLVY